MVFASETERALFEQLSELERIKQQLRRYGILIRMQLVLREGLSPPAALELVHALRRLGFAAYRIERTEITLTGEPCLALAFMDRADAAGVLSEEFRHRLEDLFDDATPRPVQDPAGQLGSLGNLFASIQSVDVPRH